MGGKTKISWCDATFNPWWGCTNVSPGCDHCYAESFAHRLGLDVWGTRAARRIFEEKHWSEPIRWNAKAQKAGKRLRVFCGSMCDILDEWKHPMEEHTLNQERARLWVLIEATPNLDWLLLTKRPQNFLKMLPEAWISQPQPNAWMMTTVESPQYLWRLDALAKVPAVVHGVSWEPGLAYVDFRPYRDVKNLWVIAGGESGASGRLFDLAWARIVRDDCKEIGAAFFLKQLGGHPDKQDDPTKWPDDLRIQEYPKGGEQWKTGQLDI